MPLVTTLATKAGNTSYRFGVKMGYEEGATFFINIHAVILRTVLHGFGRNNAIPDGE